MKKKNAFTLLVLLSLLLTQIAVVPTAFAASCDAAQFVSDVTVLDGTSFKAGETFDKIWRLKNVGTCTWTTSYNLVLDSGNALGTSGPVPFTKNVAPGETVDLTVKNMTAPSTTGLIRSNWKLRNAGNVLFGIGFNADKAFWVEIRVKSDGGSSGGTGYDFAQKAGEAAWTSGAGTLPFPGTATDLNGAGLKVDSPKLEDGSNAGAPGLLMVPQSTYNGFVQAQYPAYRVQSGDRFKSIINCEYNATSCYVNFRLDYQIGSGAVTTFWSFNERYEGLYYPADINLNALAGQDVKFILRIGAAGYATGDRALWGAPRISSSAGPVITNTPSGPTNTPGPSKTPGTSTCVDKVNFISDLDVPDGKVFGADQAFTKTWRLKNVGTCTWTTSYKLVFVSGEKMGASANEINLEATINPNTTVDIPLKLKSPATNGKYRGYWQFKNAQGDLFGLGSANQPFWVDIVVRGGGNQATPTKTSVPNSGSDRATFIEDKTVPDGSIYGPSISFKKTWRIKNTGTSTWGSGYKLIYVSGNQMSGPNEVPLAATVAPNGVIDITVDLISPSTSGSYRGFWQLKNAAGTPFGIGSTADRPFWVDISVNGGIVPPPAATSTITPTLGATPTVTQTPPVGATATVTQTPTVGVTPTITATATVTPTP